MGLIRDLLTRGLDDAILAREDPIESVGRARSVDELIFNQIEGRFELAIELEIPDELHKSTGNGRYRIARYEVAIGKDPEKGELIITNEALWLCPKRQLSTNPQLSFFPNETNPTGKRIRKNVPGKVGIRLSVRQRAAMIIFTRKLEGGTVPSELVLAELH